MGFFSIPLCALLNQHLALLARKFPGTKFLKSISTTCIPNWPDSNLPTIFVYNNGNMIKQFIGPIELRGMKITESGKNCFENALINLYVIVSAISRSIEFLFLVIFHL